jgi:MtN3 and saliva related transmembrane protein
MDWIQILGLTAGCLTSTATLPQLIKTYKTKDARDISLKMFSILVVGIILWVVYGFFKSDIPIIVTNTLAVILNIIMLVFKFKYGKK